MISTQPARDNYADSQFAGMLQLRNVGVQIPDDRIIERSNLENKFELAKEIRQMTGRGPQTPEQIQAAQMQEQIAIQTAIAELHKLEATAVELQTRAEMNRAKAEAVGPEMQAKYDELEVNMQAKREEIRLRQQLQLMTSMNKLDVAHTSNKGKMNQMVLEHKLGDKNINGG